MASTPNGPCVAGQAITPPAGFTTWTYNDFLVGGIWTDGTLPPTAKNEFGSLNLANSTLETFTQGATCFSCHSARNGKQPPFALSHAFLQGKAGTCSYSAQLPAQCSATQK